MLIQILINNLKNVIMIVYSYTLKTEVSYFVSYQYVKYSLYYFTFAHCGINREYFNFYKFSLINENGIHK